MKNRNFIVGCNRYTNFADLHFGENDALKFASTIEEILGAGSSETTLVPTPTKEEFSREFGNFASTLKPGDRASIFFAGHGYSLEGDDRLALSDSTLEEVSSFISVTSLIGELQQKEVQATFYLDACRERAQSRKITGESSNPFGRNAIVRASADTSTVLFFGCRQGHLSFECKIGGGDGQGVFTHLICNALKAEGPNNPIEIDKRIEELSEEFYASHSHVERQEPFSAVQPVKLANIDLFTGEVANVESQQSGRLLILAGPSNAGKTSLAQHISSRFKWRHAEMSSFAYERYNDFKGENPEVDWSIQEFMEREVWQEKDYSIIANDFLSSVEQGEDILLSGVRRPEEIEEIRGKIQNVDIVFLFANARVRFGRHLENAPDGHIDRMGTTYKEFVKRDLKEFGWGMGKVESMDRTTLMINESSVVRLLAEADEKITG